MESSPRLPKPVLVGDRLQVRLRRSEDLYEALGCLVGIALVLILGVYAHATTVGFAEDVRIVFGSFIRQILLLPASFLEGMFVVIAPVAIIIALLRRRQYQSVFEMILTGAAAAVIGQGITSLVPLMPAPVVDSLMIALPSGSVVSLDVVIIVLAASFTAAGDSAQIKSLRYSWWGIWFLLLIGVIRGTATMPGMLVTVLLGRLFGCVARWTLGFDDKRAGPAELVEALLHVGVIPTVIIRADLPTLDRPLEMWQVSESEEQPDYASGRTDPQLLVEAFEEQPKTYELAVQTSSFADRHYQAWDEEGHCYDLHILDPGRAITGTIGEVWNSLRLRGISRWIAPVVKANAERAVLNAMTAAKAGVTTPAPEGIAEAGDSIAVVWQAPPPMVPLTDPSDIQMEQAWLQLIDAHSRGVGHRNLDLGALTLDQNGHLWILHWEQGEVATSELNRNIDRAQMLALLSVLSTRERALRVAQKYFDGSELAAIAMVMQPAVLPPGVRSRLKRTKTLPELRESLVPNTPAAQVRPLKLQRFAPRTVVLATVAVLAVVVVFGSLNFDSVVAAVRDANPLWMLLAFLMGATAWVGAAIPLRAFAPRKISLINATLAQIAASLATVVAPAGVGPAALNLRFLTKEKIKMPAAIATVTLVQISQFLTSVVLLLTIAVATGTSLDLAIPTMTVVWSVAAVASVAAGILAIGKVRNWVWRKLEPFWNQAYPHLVWVMAHPKELAIALGGNILVNMSYMGAFAASLYAFGYTLTPISLVTTYLISNTLGSVIPSPGGIGPVEVALTGGLTTAGILPAVALSTAVLFRLVTFYGRIPFGWLAMHFMQRRNLL